MDTLFLSSVELPYHMISLFTGNCGKVPYSNIWITCAARGTHAAAGPASLTITYSINVPLLIKSFINSKLKLVDSCSKIWKQTH